MRTSFTSVGVNMCVSLVTAFHARPGASHRFQRVSLSNLHIPLPLASAALIERATLPSYLQSSPVEEIHGIFDDHLKVYVKRDDKLDLLGAGIHGNKARKLWGLASSYPLSSSRPFPAVCLSWGGVQSNALAALAGFVCSVQQKRLIYYTKTIPAWLKDHPVGNYRRALELGVDFRELRASEFQDIFGATDETEGGDGEARCIRLKKRLVEREGDLLAREADDLLLVPQGAAFPGAEEGIDRLGREVEDWWATESGSGERAEVKPLAVVLPAGTGTTAFYLARTLASSSLGRTPVVYAVPCVGDGTYLRAQMARLTRSEALSETPARPEGRGVPGGRKGGKPGAEHGSEGWREKTPQGAFPEVLEGSAPHVFGQPGQALIDMWHEMGEKHGLELDLLYGPRAWCVIRQHWSVLRAKHDKLLYIHTGGMEGLPSQLARYRYRKMLPDPGE